MEKENFEFAFHDWLTQQIGNRPDKLAKPGQIVGIGDDAAVVAWDDDSMVATHDTICENVHFLLDGQPLERIGRKALAVSLSDIAAMGGQPRFALITLTLPRDFSLGDAQSLMRGIIDLAAEFNVEVVGGDTNRWNQGLVIGTTVIGSCLKPWKISGARPGDVLLTTGPFGGSITGHHLTFSPKFKLVGELARRYTIHAATDVSDSLSIDLKNICDASGCGATLFLDQIPMTVACMEMAKGDRNLAVQHALTDGEDFELLLSVDDVTWQAIQRNPSVSSQLTAIGRIDEQPGLRIKDQNGVESAISASGFEH